MKCCGNPVLPATALGIHISLDVSLHTVFPKLPKCVSSTHLQESKPSFPDPAGTAWSLDICLPVSGQETPDSPFSGPSMQSRVILILRDNPL